MRSIAQVGAVSLPGSPFCWRWAGDPQRDALGRETRHHSNDYRWCQRHTSCTHALGTFIPSSFDRHKRAAFCPLDCIGAAQHSPHCKHYQVAGCPPQTRLVVQGSLCVQLNQGGQGAQMDQDHPGRVIIDNQVLL